VQFHAGPDNRWARARRKSRKDERRRQRNVGDPRKILLAAQQIEVIQPRACHAGLEFASRRNKQEIQGYSVQACLVIIGVDKGARAAPWHSFSLQISRRIAADPGLGAGKRLLTMQIQEAARADPKFFPAWGLRAGAAVLPRVSVRTPTDRPPRSGPIPRRHNSSQSRSQWLSSDRPFAALDGPDASAAAKGSVSGSSRDVHSRGCE